MMSDSESSKSENWSVDIFSNSEDDFVPPTSSDSGSSDDETKFLRRKRLVKKKASTNRRLKFERTSSITRDKENENKGGAFNQMTGTDNRHDDTSMENPVTVPGLITLSGIVTTPDTPKKKCRKIVSKPSTWKSNIRKERCQAGKMYMIRRGKEVPAKEVKSLKNCNTSCKFKCSRKISHDERLELHNSYYSCGNNEKRHFIVNTSERSLTARPKRTNSVNPKRLFSFKYFFNVKGEKIQVCKSFYLGTLDISQKPIYTVHASKNQTTNTPESDQRGKSCESRRKPTGDVNFVYDHIKSFPTVESHYCRARTDRKYLTSDLSVAKMYELYLEKCREKELSPVKQSMYYNIFVTKFNLAFHEPKSDRCDVCEKYNVAKKSNNIQDDFIKDYNIHIEEKNSMREERQKDKERDVPVLLFDLENVITCPRANISSFFYTRKLNVYNLTAYYSVTKQVYCAIWSETMSGRAGNDIASAVRKILDVVVEENEVTNLITWSDSCIPQNRNSIMSCAIMDFLRDNENIQTLTMKYSVPGHSCVQEVDSVHSLIEKDMMRTEIYSPIGLIRLLKQIRRHNPFRVIQMRDADFKDFSSVSKLFNYKAVPFSQISTITFSQTLHIVEYKISHKQNEPVTSVNLKFSEKRGRKRSASKVLEVKPKVQNNLHEISDEKKRDIKKMLPFMTEQDKKYFQTVLHL